MSGGKPPNKGFNRSHAGKLLTKRPQLVSGGAEFDPVEAPCGKIVRADPELVNAFGKMMGEALIRG